MNPPPIFILGKGSYSQRAAVLTPQPYCPADLMYGDLMTKSRVMRQWSLHSGMLAMTDPASGTVEKRPFVALDGLEGATRIADDFISGRID